MLHRDFDPDRVERVVVWLGLVAAVVVGAALPLLASMGANAS